MRVLSCSSAGGDIEYRKEKEESLNTINIECCLGLSSQDDIIEMRGFLLWEINRFCLSLMQAVFSL